MFMYQKIIVNLEDPGIDPGTSRMLSGRSTIWANPPASAYNALGQDLTPSNVYAYDLMK